MTSSPRTWRRSSHSSSGGNVNCVEAASCSRRTVAIRDSKQAPGPILTITPTEWTALLTTLKSETSS